MITFPSHLALVFGFFLGNHCTPIKHLTLSVC